MRYIAAILLWVISCGGASLERHVQARDWAALERGLDQATKSGELTAGDVRDLALEVVRVELASARHLPGARRVLGLRPCARALVSPLKSLADGSDSVAAVATRLLVELDEISQRPLVEKYANAREPLWRAVAARAAIGPEFAGLRVRWLADGDAHVRRAALEAVGPASGPLELEELLQVVRHDPEPLHRSLAARAAAASGSERAVLFLRDYWAAASPEDRLAYVEAWAQPEARAAGGDRELEWVLGTQAGLAPVAAAAALEQRVPAANAALVRALKDGGSGEQLLAARLISVSRASSITALKEVAVKGGDPQVTVAIWSRLARVPGESVRARAALQALARKGDAVARQARYALAAVGDRSVKAALISELRSPMGEGRQSALRALIQLGEIAEGAHLLADRVADTRTKAACALLMSEAFRH